MHRLQSVGVLSVGRTMAAVHGGLAVILVPIFLLMAVIGAIAAPGAQKLSALLFVVFALIMPFLYAAVGFLMGILMAVAYNFVAARLGGIEMHFIPAPLESGTGLPQPYNPPTSFPASS